MNNENDSERALVTVSASHTVGDHKCELRCFELTKRCLVLVRDIAERATRSWDAETTDAFFQDLRTVLAPTTIQQSYQLMKREDATSSLEKIYRDLVEIAENLPAYGI